MNHVARQIAEKRQNPQFFRTFCLLIVS
jgi:hypothetical protein